MQTSLSTLYSDYFQNVTNLIPKIDAQFIVLTHLLSDRPELLHAISQVAPISLLIGIPYSVHKPTYLQLRKSYHTMVPTLEQLYDEDYLLATTLANIDKNKPLIILEIGGYFAPILNALQKALQGNLIGVIEDTELGHRQYEKYLNVLPCPVISVARSALKATEDFLVGASCLYSTEKMLRNLGFPMAGNKSLVLGFGKIGRGIAHGLLHRQCEVAVYDIDPIRRVNALSEGFQIPDKAEALKTAALIFGATGVCSMQQEDFKLIKNGALLISCSSKDVEFDLAFLKRNFQMSLIKENIEVCSKDNQFFYLAAHGCPINFVDGAVIGPVLALVQSEILLAINQLLSLKNHCGLFETNLETKKILADQWLKHFCDKVSGHYKLIHHDEMMLKKVFNSLELVSSKL